MTYLALQIACTAYCLYIGLFMVPADNRRSRVIFNAIPLIIGFSMAFFLVARFMGWPV